MSAPLIPVQRAFGWIALSVILVVGVAIAGWFYYDLVKARRAADEAYQLFAIVQTGPDKEALKTGYLAELLNLSVDLPVNLYAFDCQLARRKLLSSPLIKMASVNTFVPGIVYVDYTARKPVAYISDFANTAIDAEGVLIPSDPFFTPKRIPSIYLGLPALDRVWGVQVTMSQLTLAFDLRRLLEASFPQEGFRIQQIDVSRASDSSFGQREIVLRLEEIVERPVGDRRGLSVQPVILRLGSGHYQQALANYAVLRTHLRSEAVKSTAASLVAITVDMRIPDLAYLSQVQQLNPSSVNVVANSERTLLCRITL